MRHPAKLLGTIAPLVVVISIACIGLIIGLSEGAQPAAAKRMTQSPRAEAFLRDNSGPVSMTAVGFGESLPVRNLPLVPRRANLGLHNIPPVTTDPTAKRVAPMESIKRYSRVPNAGDVSNDDKEINKLNRQPGRPVDPHVTPSRDGALSTENPYQNLSPTVLPTPSVSFDGLSFADTVTVSQGFLPPDMIGDVGPSHIVQAVNASFRVWDKQGNPLTPVTSLGSLFSAVPGTCSGNIDGDPIVLYDQMADRWLISEFCWDNVFPRHQLIAISKTGDPTGAYYLYDFVMPNTEYNDYPKFGAWPDGYYMSDNQWDRTGLFFRGAGFFAFDRSKMLAGDPSAAYIFFDTCPTKMNCKVYGALPSDMEGFIPPPPEAPNTFAYYTADEFNDPQGDALRLFDFHADFVRPENSDLIERADSPLPSAPFDAVSNFIVQPLVSTWSHLAPLGDYTMNRLSYRRFENGRETLVLTHTVDTPTEDHSGVRYYQLDRTTPSGSFQIAEQQTFAPDSHSRWIGSVATNHLGDTAIGYSVSSSTVYPSLRYAARLATNPPGSGLYQGEQVIVDGTGAQTSSTRRWGDYSNMVVDPSDDCSFWYTGEYYVITGSAPWRTRIAKFAPRACSTSPRGTIHGNITHCSTGAPLPSVAVQVSGGFERTTGSSGSYSMTVSPGSYNIAPKKLGYYAAPVDVVVGDGAEVTRNFCMSPVATLESPGPMVVSGNNIAEPNECVYLNIPLVNRGASDATATSAVLSANSPGVAVLSSTSAYPNIAKNGGIQTNLTHYKIVIDPSVACLSTVDLTLTVTYAGGGSPSVIELDLPIGQPAGPNYEFSATTGATLPDTGVLVPGSQDDISVPVTVPFDFTVYGKSIRAGDVITADAYGVLELVPPTLANPYPVNSRLPTGTFDSPIGVLMPYWTALEMLGVNVPGAGIYIETTGTAPNRTFMIEWRARNAQPSGPVDTDVAIFFHENSDSFDYVYKLTGGIVGPLGTANGGGATVGVQGRSWGTNFTQYSYHQPVITPGLKLTARRPAPICSVGTGSCGPPPTPSPSPTPVRKYTGLGVGNIPDGLPGSPPVYGPPLSINFNVFGRTAPLTKVTTDITLNHTWSGDVDMVLSSPGGIVNHITASRLYVNVAGTYGSDNDYAGKYTFTDDATGLNIWYMANLNPIPPGEYRTTEGGYGGQLYPAPVTDLTAAFANLTTEQINGTWTLTVRDAAQDETGTVTAANLYLTDQTMLPTRPPSFDYDGDTMTDISVYRPSSGIWYVRQSSGEYLEMQFGTAGDKIAPADFDGDRRTDIAIFRPSEGRWYIFNSQTSTFTFKSFGISEDQPVPADYDGDGRADLTVFRPSLGTWYRQNSSDGTFFGLQFGQNGDVPTLGDFDGDGKNDIGIFRPSVGDWYHIRSSNGSIFGERFGQVGDKIAPGDFDSDGRTDIAVFRPATGLWAIRNSATATYSYYVFGTAGDVPVPGDYDGDGRDDIGVWRPTDGVWYVRRSVDAGFVVVAWGQSGDMPGPYAYGN